MSGEDHVFRPVLGAPRGMVSTIPPVQLADGYDPWIENYMLSRGSYQSRRGFEKYNRYSIPKSGLRLDGSTQYVEVPGADDADSAVVAALAFSSSNDLVVSIAFMLEDLPDTDGVNERRMPLVTFGLSSASAAVAHKWYVELFKSQADDLIQVRAGVGGSSINTAFTSSGDMIKPGIGYRVYIVKDTSIAGDHIRLLVFREGTATAIANVTGTVGNLATQGRLLIGKSLLTGLGSNLITFKGIVQDFQFWNYSGTLPQYTDPEDQLVLRYNTEPMPAEVTNDLLIWLPMDDNTNSSLVVANQSNQGSTYDGLKKPGRATWVTPGLVDNAPTTYAVKLDPDDGHYLKCKDRPSSMGGSCFNLLRANTNYEFSVSMAIEVDAAYISRMENETAAPSVLPLFYYGDDSGGGGDDYQLTGNFAIAIWLENTGTAGASVYKVRAVVQFEDDTTTGNIGPSTHTITPGTKYRIDFSRGQGRYFWYRVYEDGERFVGAGAADAESRYDAGAAKAALELEDTAWSNGEVFYLGTLNDAGTQIYFPGKIDDVRVFTVNAETLPVESNIAQNPFSGLSNNDNRLVFYAKLNEGTGKYFTDSSAFNNNQASATGEIGEHHELYPDITLATHGTGWVKPNRYLAPQGARGYRDIETGLEAIFAVVGGSVWVSPFGQGTFAFFVPIYHGLDASRAMTFAHVGNQLIMGDGLNDNLRFDGKHFGTLGIDAPANAPGLSSSNPGNILAGTYTYVYAWKNSKTGGRSNPSPSAAITLATTDDVSVRFWLPDSNLATVGVDTVEIWRTKNAGATYYFVGEVKVPKRDGTQATAATVVPPYTDTTPDGSLSATLLTSVTAYSKLPKCRYMLSVKGRLFGFGQDRYPNRIVWTELHFPDHHDPAKQFSDDLDSGDGDEITGVVYVNDLVYVFQRRHIWAISSAENEASIRIYLVHKGVGCVTHNTIQAYGGTVFWRGEDNFYSLPPGATEPQRIGDAIRSLLELVDPDTIRDETSAVLRQESIYLCSVTSVASTLVDSDLRNDYVFAYDMAVGGWSLWSMNGLGYFTQIDLSDESQLYYLSRHGFMYKYSGRGVNDDTGSRRLTFIDGLARTKRSWFTLGADLVADATHIDVIETSADTTIDDDQDGMKGLPIRFFLDDGTLSSTYFIRKMTETSGSVIRLFLTKAITETASIGNEVFVGGYTRKIITADRPLGQNPFIEKTVQGLSMLLDGPTGGPIPIKAPTVTIASGAVALRYAYTYEVDGDESRLSPITSATGARATSSIVCYAPDRDLGTTVKINLYVATASVGFQLVDSTTMTTETKGQRVTFTDAGGATSTVYDSDTRNALLELTGEFRRRGTALRTATTTSDLRRDVVGYEEWRIPFVARGNVFRLTIECPYPDSYHEIQGAALLENPGESRTI